MRPVSRIITLNLDTLLLASEPATNPKSTTSILIHAENVS